MDNLTLILKLDLAKRERDKLANALATVIEADHKWLENLNAITPEAVKLAMKYKA